MPSTDDIMLELDRLRVENANLRALLEAHGIEIPAPKASGVHDRPSGRCTNPAISKHSPSADKIDLFLSLFQGRPDVYARRWESQNGRCGYSPACKNYGLVIVDECHHVPAVSFEQVMKVVRSKYAYGLTATPTRQDGHHPILHMYLGPIRYRVDAKAQALRRPFAHVMIPRFTGSRFRIDVDSRMPAISQYYDQIMRDDLRNDQIVQDVLDCIGEGRNCLILSERTDHVRKLTELLRARGATVYMLLGGQTNARMKAQLLALKNARLRNR